MRYAGFHPLRLTPYASTVFRCRTEWFQLVTDTHTDTNTYSLSEAGRGWETQIELGAAWGIGVGRFRLRISGRGITSIGAK